MATIKDLHKMCWSIDDCKDCKLDYICPLAFSGLFFENRDEVETVEKVVDEWKEKHQETYLDDFKKKFPNSNYDDSMIIRWCVSHLYGIKCPEIACKECWEMPVEE